MTFKGANGERIAPWSLVFDTWKGAFVSYEFAGKQLIDSPLMPCFARAAVENDNGANQQKRTAMWRDADLEFDRFEVVNADNCCKVEVFYKPLGEMAAVSVLYEIYADGTVSGVEVLKDAGKLAEAPILPRFGMEFAMPGEFSDIEYFGLGPHENYCDRYSSALMDKYSQRVEDQYHYGYVRPQESGTKTQIKWMRIMDDNGTGLEITSDMKFSASALPFHWREMDCISIGNEQAHSLELKSKACENKRSEGRTWVNFDLKQMGLACVNSWGAWPREEHLIRPAEYTFRFTLTPVNN
jgi:beta-galactosidase